MKRRTLLAVTSAGVATMTSGCLTEFGKISGLNSAENEPADTELRFIGVYADETDREFIDYEYVLLENGSDDSLDVSGHVVEYPSNDTYQIEELVLEPGAQLAILSRSGQDTTLTSSPPVYLRYAGFGAEAETSALEESGTIRVRNSDGTTVTDVDYENFGCDGETGTTESGDGLECLH